MGMKWRRYRGYLYLPYYAGAGWKVRFQRISPRYGPNIRSRTATLYRTEKEAAKEAKRLIDERVGK